MKTKTARRARPANLSNRGIGSLPLSYIVVIAICGCIIAAGFLLAARQHFMSMDLGMKNSKLRKQLEDLETENRRLTLAREVALSPREITRTARNLGFVDMFDTTTTVPISAPVSGKSTNASVVNTSLAPNSDKANTPAVSKTAYQRPSPPDAAKAASMKKPGAEKQMQKSEHAKHNVIRPELTAVAKLR